MYNAHCLSDNYPGSGRMGGAIEYLIPLAAGILADTHICMPLVSQYKRRALIFHCSLVCQLSEYLIELDALGCDLGAMGSKF